MAEAVFGPGIRAVGEIFREHGYRLFAVGGAVRYALSKEAARAMPAETDLCSGALIADIERMFQDKPEVGVLTLNGDLNVCAIETAGDRMEHAAFRKEEYGGTSSHRPSKVSFGVTLEEDAARRDFSINAVYMDVLTGEVIDPVGGRTDIETGRLRTAADPLETLSCDGERIMRLARFHGELGFGLDFATLDAAMKHAYLVGDLSIGRQRRELDRMLTLKSGGGRRALLLLHSFGALKYVLPELYDADVFYAIDMLSYVQPVLERRLKAMLKEVEDKEAVLRRLQYGKDVRAKVLGRG